MKQLETAAPYLLDMPTDFSLTDEVFNKELLSDLKNKPNTVLKKIRIGGVQSELRRVGDTTDGNIYIEHKDKIFVLIKYHTYHYNFLPVKTITQTRLWKSDKITVTYDFSMNLFFNSIIKITGAVLSDREHTEYGMQFWKRRCMDAWSKGMRVYRIDFNKQLYEAPTTEIQLSEWLEDSWNHPQPKAYAIRWMIVDKKRTKV